MHSKWLGGIAPLSLLAALLAAAPAQADTLRDALSQAYVTNPNLLAARAHQRQVDENVPLARSEGMPSISATGAYTENVKQSAASFASPARQFTAGVNGELPIFQGGAVRNAVQAAKVRVEAGRADLRTAESNVFTDVVAAYMDVIRDQAIVELNAGQVGVLDTNLRASKDRFEVGDLTRTDVAQSEARLSLSRSQLEAAQARLVASREAYLAAVGKTPDDLQAPPPLPGLPASVDTALAIAMENNPQLLSARKQGDAARYDVGTARASRLPRLSAVAGGNYFNYLDSLAPIPGIPIADRGTAASVGIQASLPLYQGGRPGARVRQAEARAGETLEMEIAAERSVISELRSAYASYSASQAVIRSSEAGVSSNELALEGVRAENSVGTRDVLDVLNAEQELLNARVQLVTARRDAYVAGFALLAAMGRAEAANLGLDGGPLYDPTVNYKRVKNAIFDWGDDGIPTAKATSTATVPPLPSVTLQPLVPATTDVVTSPKN